MAPAPPPSWFKVLEFLSLGSIVEFLLWTAICGLAMRSNAAVAMTLLQPTRIAQVFLTVVAQIFFTYTVDRYRDCARESDKINSPQRTVWFMRNERLVLVLLALSVAVGALLPILSFSAPLPWFVNFLFMGLYSFPFMAGLRVKDVPWLKTPYIAVCTAMTASLVAGAAGISLLDPRLSYVLVYVALSKFVNSVMNDFRDVVGDAAEGVPTLPVLIGLDGCKALLSVLGTAAAAIALGPLRSPALLLLPALMLWRVWHYDAKTHTPWRTNVAWNCMTVVALALLP